METREDTVTIAILVKDKAHCLPLYLKCIEKQTFPKKQTYLYIRTNDNRDQTQDILLQWLEHNKHLYKDIYYDEKSVDETLKKYSPHEWNPHRFNILAHIRQESVEWAKERKSHYFVADCDNFIHPQTIEILVKSHRPVIGPFLVTGNNIYSNYHHRTDENGYFFDNYEYRIIYNQAIKGLIEVDVIHCTYLIRQEYLDDVSYFSDQKPNRHEYVIFSENLRRQGIQQYLDNRHVYGRITFTDNVEDLQKETWFNEFMA